MREVRKGMLLVISGPSARARVRCMESCSGMIRP